MALFFALTASAQHAYYEGDLTHIDRGGKRIWLHEGKPLQGPCKISYMDSDLSARYMFAHYRDGVRGDTVSYFLAPSNTPLLTEIRLGERERYIRDYRGFDGSYLREWREVDGRREGACREWYDERRLRRYQGFKAGKQEGTCREWDEAGRLVEECTYRADRLDGPAKRWRYEGPDSGEIEVSYHRQIAHPYMIERYAFQRDQQGLIERTIPDGEGHTLYAARKSDCDSTRIDTICGARMIVEIRDFKEGAIRSLERYDAFSGTLIPHGVFESYTPSGQVARRMRYEDGELTATRDYDSDAQPHRNVTTTLLSREAGQRLLADASDSKYLDRSDDCRPLYIRNRAGDVIFERDEEERRYEYYGYDPNLKLHVGFSSVGDWNDVQWYVLHEDGGEIMELHEDLFVVNGKSGAMAGAMSYFEGELDLSVYRHCPDEETGGFFEILFNHMLEVSGPVWGMHWVGERSLLLVTEEGCIRVDLAPEALTGQEGESY